MNIEHIYVIYGRIAQQFLLFDFFIFRNAYDFCKASVKFCVQNSNEQLMSRNQNIFWSSSVLRKTEKCVCNFAIYFYCVRNANGSTPI